MLRRRVITAVIAVLVLAVVLFGLPTMAARAVIALLMLGAAWEWSGFIFKDMHIGRYLYVVFIGLLMAAVYSQLPDAELVDVIFRIALGWWLAALAWTFYYPTPILPAIAWICGVLVIGPAWLALDFLYLTAPDLLLFALLIVWIADIGAYFVGKGFGRVKLAPQVSPGQDMGRRTRWPVRCHDPGGAGKSGSRYRNCSTGSVLCCRCHGVDRWRLDRQHVQTECRA